MFAAKFLMTGFHDSPQVNIFATSEAVQLIRQMRSTWLLCHFTHVLNWSDWSHRHPFNGWVENLAHLQDQSVVANSQIWMLATSDWSWKACWTTLIQRAVQDWWRQVDTQFLSAGESQLLLKVWFVDFARLIWWIYHLQIWLSHIFILHYSLMITVCVEQEIGMQWRREWQPGSQKSKQPRHVLL